MVLKDTDDGLIRGSLRHGTSQYSTNEHNVDISRISSMEPALLLRRSSVQTR